MTRGRLTIRPEAWEAGRSYIDACIARQRARGDQEDVPCAIYEHAVYLAAKATEHFLRARDARDRFQQARWHLHQHLKTED